MDEYFPAPGVPRFEALVTPAWVRAVQTFEDGGRRGPRPPSYRGDRLAIVEVSWATLDEASAYLAGHLSGAVHLNTDDLEDGYPTWKLRPLGELHQVAGALGITPGTAVVVYSDRTIAAARAWWVLMYAGVEDVRLMDGGFAAWNAAGFPGETGVQAPVPAVFTAKPREAFLATTQYLRARLDDGGAVVADARSHAEFAGEASGYDYLDARGRIPGAIHIGDADDGAHLYQHADGSLRDPGEIAAIWQRSGLPSPAPSERGRKAAQPDRATGTSERGREAAQYNAPAPSERGGEAAQPNPEVIFSCGSGWRSSLAFFYAWLLGYEHIRNYSDGWCGWSTHYVRDESAAGRTPGWRQAPTGNPVDRPD